MIFQQWSQVLDGTKTQTRRPVKEGEKLVAQHWPHGIYCQPTVIRTDHLGLEGRVKYQVGRTYAVQPGRGKKAVGRIGITKIRRERLQEISYEDVAAEGCDMTRGIFLRDGTARIDHKLKYGALWDSIYGSGAWDRMKDDDVWVLSFKLVENSPE